MITIPRSSLQLFLCSTVPTNEGGTRSSCVETSGWRRNEYSRYLYDFLSSSFSRFLLGKAAFDRYLLMKSQQSIIDDPHTSHQPQWTFTNTSCGHYPSRPRRTCKHQIAKRCWVAKAVDLQGSHECHGPVALKLRLPAWAVTYVRRSLLQSHSSVFQVKLGISTWSPASASSNDVVRLRTWGVDECTWFGND